MSRGGGGGFRGRGYGAHDHRRQGPGPDLSGGSGSRGNLASRHNSISRQDASGPRASGPNHDGSNSHGSAQNFNQRGGINSIRGPCPNFNPSRRHPRPPNRGTANWSTRGNSLQFASWRGTRSPRFNCPQRAFYRGRGSQAQFLPRYPFVPTGNFPPPFLPYQPTQEAKIPEKPAVPHLGSEEERQQKITEAADALKRKLSAVAKESGEWRDDEDETLGESFCDNEQDSRIANKGIPELKHDPPELNLTLNDLRDIGRVDHEYKSEQTKNNTDNENNYEFDESEVEILAHNPVKPRIEIDLYGDDNYTDFTEDESINRINEDIEVSSHAQDFNNDKFTSNCNFQSFSNDFTFAINDNYEQESTNIENIDKSMHQEISIMENLIDQQNVTISQCNNEEINAKLQMEVNCSERCEKGYEAKANDPSDDKNDEELMVVGKATSEEISANSEELKKRQLTIEETENVESINRNEENFITDNLDNFHSNKIINNLDEKMQQTDKNDTKKSTENWVELSNTRKKDDTRIPGLDSLYPNENVVVQSVDESKIVNDTEKSINESERDENNLKTSVVEMAIENREIMESRKELTSENVDKTLLTQPTEVIKKKKSDKRVKNDSERKKEDTSRETRYDKKSDDKRDCNKDREVSGFNNEPTNDTKNRAIMSRSREAELRERGDESDKKSRDSRSSESWNKRDREENEKKSRNRETKEEKSRDRQSKDEKSREKRSKDDNPRDRQSKDEKSDNSRSDRIKSDLNKKTDSRNDSEISKTIEYPIDNSQDKIMKTTETTSGSDKKMEASDTDKQDNSINDHQKNQERKRLVRNMNQIGPRSRSRVATISNVPPEFDPREPPPMPFNKNLFAKPPPTIIQTSQDSTETPHLPPVFDPRLSSSARNALLPSLPSAIAVQQDFTINQTYPSPNINNFSSIVPTINYGPRAIIGPTSVENAANIPPPICLGDPYTPILPMPNVPIVTPIPVPTDNSQLLAPFNIKLSCPMTSSRKTNIDMDDGLEYMQEAMEFAKEVMNMDERAGNAGEANFIDPDFFHMPTFPDLPPIDVPPFLPADIPTPPEIQNISSNRKTTKKEESRKRNISKQDNDESRSKSTTEEMKNNETVEYKSDLTLEERPKVMFNLSSKNKLINKDNEWNCQQERDDNCGSFSRFLTSIPAISTSSPSVASISKTSPSTSASTEKNRLINAREDIKKSQQHVTEKKSISKLSSNNCQSKKPEEEQIQSKISARSRSPSPGKSKQPKQQKSLETSSGDSSRSEISSRKVTKESSGKKSSEETPESSWKSRVIGRFLKMSKNDICNMLNNTGLRKFDIAMKHLVKERSSTLSFNMRKKEEEKLKDPEACYNREEFMDQLSAMLDPSATVDVCNLPTQFLHHLSEVLQLDSMSEFGGPFTPLETVEAPILSSTQRITVQTPRLSRENSNGKEIDDRRSSKRGREKKSTNTPTPTETIPVTSSTLNKDVKKSSRLSEESNVQKAMDKKSNIGEESEKIGSLDSVRIRRRLQRQSINEQQAETSVISTNGSSSRENSNSLNMAVIDDIFSEGIAKAKKKIVQQSKNDKNTGNTVNEAFSASNKTEKYLQLEKDTNVDRSERTAVELDKIFTAGIAKAKLASRNAAAAAARGNEANDGEEDEDDAGWKYNDDKTNSHNNRGKHRSISRNFSKCDKWNRRKAREDLDGFRNLTREEWEAKYGETSDSAYEREYRAMVAIDSRKNPQSPNNYRDNIENFGEDICGSGGNVMSRLGNIVPSGSGINEQWSASDEDRRLRNDFDNADYQIESYDNSSEDDSSSSSTSASSSDNSDAKNPQVPSVTKLLKVIKAREKIGKKRSINEEIRDEVNADIERKRREREKASGKRHKSKTKKSHRRRKDKKLRVREKKRRVRKRRKRRSRKSGSDDEHSGDEDSDDPGNSSMKKGKLLTEDEIKQEMDLVVVKKEPDSEILQANVDKQQKISIFPATTVEESRSSGISSAVDESRSSSIPSAVEESHSSSISSASSAPPTTISPSQMKTKAQLKQLPANLLAKSSAVADILADTPKILPLPVKEVSKEIVDKVEAPLISSASSPVVSESSNSSQSLITNSAVKNNPSAIINTDNLLSKGNSKKLDFNEYKERTRLRVLRENEKIRMITENPSSLTQDLLNIPLSRKKVGETNETVNEISEARKDPRLTKHAKLASINSSDNTISATSKSLTVINAANVSEIDSPTGNKISNVAKNLENCTTNVKPATSTTNVRSDFSTTNFKASASSTITDKNATITNTTTDNISAIKNVPSDNISATKNSTTAEIPAISTTTTKTSSDTITTPIISPISDPADIPSTESPNVQQTSSTKSTKLIRRRSLTIKLPETEGKLRDARVEAGKFAHIKSEGSKEMKLREKLKKGRQRVSSEGLETTISLPTEIRLKKDASSVVRSSNEESTSLDVNRKFDELALKEKFEYFGKGIVSDLLPDTVPQEFLSLSNKETTKIDDILDQTDLDPLTLPIAELSNWPLDSSAIPSNIDDDIDTSSSPPFKGFPAEPILRRDRVLTEAELNSEIGGDIEAVSLAFEDGADALPMSTVVDLNDLRSSSVPLNEPISYGDEEFVEGRVEIETSLLGFSVTNDITDEPEAIAALEDNNFISHNIDKSVEKFPEESRESIDILPRVTSTLNDSPAPVDFLVADVRRPESIPSPLLVTESTRDNNDRSIVTDFFNNQAEEKKKKLITTSDDVAEVTSSHQSNINPVSDVYHENAVLDEESSSSKVTSNAEDKDIRFRTQVNDDKPEDVYKAQEIQGKKTFVQDTKTKNVPSTNSKVEMIDTPPPQPSSSSDSTEQRNKEISMEIHRDTSESRDCESKIKESSHHSHSKSRDHLHGKRKRKSSRHHNHESKSKKKIVITEKIVKEAVASNIVKLVNKPTSRESVMARMIEIDVEIHKLMNEKMTLYKMLEGGEFPVNEDATEAVSAKSNSEDKNVEEHEEIRETVPPNVLASRLVRDLDKNVLSTPTTVQDNLKKSEAKKCEAEEETKKEKQKKNLQQEMKNRTKDNSTENRRQRKISESKRHSRTATSEESSRQDTSSSNSREKSTSSTEQEDCEEKNQQRKTKSLVNRSPNRRNSKRSREHSSKEDVRDASRESTEQNVKSKKQETRNLHEENAPTKMKRKTKNVEAKKSEEKAKIHKEEKKINADSRVTHKNESADKKIIDDAAERPVIYSDESTLDSPAPETLRGDEQRGKKDSGTSTGLALLEESFKREMAETRKHKNMEKRKIKKQELRRIILDSSTFISEEDDNNLKKETKVKDKFGNKKVMKHITTVIDAVAENRIEQLYNEDTSSETRDSFSENSTIKDIDAEEKEEEEEKIIKADKDAAKKLEESKSEDSNDSETILQQEEAEQQMELKEKTEISDAKITLGNEKPEETPEDDISDDEYTKTASKIETLADRSIKNMDLEKSAVKSAKIDENSIKNNDNSAEKEQNKEDKREEKKLSVTINESEGDEKKKINDETSKDSSSPLPEVKYRASKKISEVEKNVKSETEPNNQISERESLKESRKIHENISESSKDRRNERQSDFERVRSKSRNGRSGKHRNVVLRDSSSREKKQNLLEKDNSKRDEETKDEVTKLSTRPRSATKRRQREKSAPPSRKSSRNPEESGKTWRYKKRDKSNSRSISPYEGEPARKKSNNSRRSSSPIHQVSNNENHSRKRGRKRKRRAEMSLEEMANCKVLLIDCKYTYLSPCMHPRILKKLGISRINPYTPPTKILKNSASRKYAKVETHSTSIFNKIEFSDEPKENAKESERNSPPENEKYSSFSVEERSSSSQGRSSSRSERPSSPKDRSSSPRDERRAFSIPKERSSSPKQPSSPLPVSAIHRVPRPILSSPDRNLSSPRLIDPLSPREINNRVEVDEDDDEDDVFDDTIQIVKAADENIALTSQSEEEDVDGVIDVIETAEDVADVAEESVDVAEEDVEVEDAAEEEVDVTNVVAEEEADDTNVAEEEQFNVVTVAEEINEDMDVAEEEIAPPPDSTADNIDEDVDNEDNSNHENLQEADTTDDIEVLEENITVSDKPDEIDQLEESEAEDDDIEPRRTRYTVHKGPILDIKVLDDSFLAASEDGAIYRYSQQSNGILNIYKGHEAAVTCIYVMRSGKFWKLYSGSLDGSFRCYDITSGLQERPPADVGSPVQCMDQAWGVFFVGTKSGHISRYNIKSGSIKGDRLEFSDKSVLALKASSEGPRRILIVASRNQPITIRDALTGLFLRIICGYKNHTVYSLMREKNLVYCGTSSTSIPVFDFTNGEQITQYNAGVGIVCMRLYRQILFAGCYDGNIYVFDTKETKLICSIPGPGNMLLSMEIVGDEIIAGSKNRQLHSWRMPREVRILLAERT